MPADRFFSPQQFVIGQDLDLPDSEARHLISVMRGKLGDTAELVNGKGQLATAVVVECGKKNVRLRVQDLYEEPKDDVEIIIAQALPRSSRLDTIVEKGCELGMTQLWLFPGERSERKALSPQQEKRLLSVSVAAMKQCGRLYLPHFEILPPIRKWQRLEQAAYFGDLSPDAPTLQSLWRNESSIVFIGPEAGFSDGEEELLRQLGARGIKLHQNILRTDTAPLVALSLIQHWRISP